MLRLYGQLSLGFISLYLSACNPSTLSEFSIESASELKITQGQQITQEITIDRKSGFSGEVILSLESVDGSKLPPGITATFNPTRVLSGLSVLTVGAATDLATKTYNLRLRGVGGNLIKTIPVNLVVEPPAKITVITQGQVLWAVYQDENGTWNPITPTDGTYSFEVRDSKGKYGVALVCAPLYPISNAIHVRIYQLTMAETKLLRATCNNQLLGDGKISGLIKGLEDTTYAYGAWGYHAGFGLPKDGNIVYEMSNLPIGNYTLVSSRMVKREVSANGLISRMADKAIILRNFAVAGQINQDLDFLSAQAFDLEGTYAVTVDGLTPPTDTNWMSINIAYMPKPFSSVKLAQWYSGDAFGYGAIPTAKREPGEAYFIHASQSQAKEGVSPAKKERVSGKGFREPTDVRLSLPPDLQSQVEAFEENGYTFYFRPKVTWNKIDNKLVRLYFAQDNYFPDSLSASKQWEVFLSQGWLGNETTYTLPNFRPLSNWQSIWRLNRNAPTYSEISLSNVSLSLDNWLHILTNITYPVDFDFANFEYSNSLETYYLPPVNPPSVGFLEAK